MSAFKKYITNNLTALIIIPLILLVIFAFINKREPLVVFPLPFEQADSLFQLSTYSDAEGNDSGSTVSQAYMDDSVISFSYNLSDFDKDNRYAGITLDLYNPISSSPYLDISKYTDIKLDIDFPYAAKQDIYLKAVIDGFTDPSDNFSHGYKRTTLPETDSGYKGLVSLESFHIPSWWLDSRKLPVGCAAKLNLSKVLQINIQSSGSTPSYTPINVKIKEIVFVRRVLPLMIPYIIAYIVYLLIVLLLRFANFGTTIPLEDDKEKIIISYDKVNIEDEQGNDLERITDFISHNFSNPDLTVDMLAKGAGVSTSKIPTLLKKKFSMNFKQYLNTVRITEAKRLLIDTDHQIVTIAHSVGYNNIPHFNRTFKQVTTISPKEYRNYPESAVNHLPGSSE